VGKKHVEEVARARRSFQLAITRALAVGHCHLLVAGTALKDHPLWGIMWDIS